MRIVRLISLVGLLQTREAMTAAELAEELGVSERTVYRDVVTLAEAGVPIYADRGRQGGYRMVAGYRSRMTGLTRSQAEALFLSGLRGPATEMGLTEALEAAQFKVQAALPPTLRDAPATAAQRFHLDAPGWFRAPQTPPLLGVLARATWQDRTVTASYRGRGGREVTRQLEPYGLVLKNGVWYLAGRVADAHTGGTPGSGTEAGAGAGAEFRTYRVDRFVDVEVTPTVFTRDEAFDLAGFWAQRAAEFARAILTDQVTLKLSPYGVRLLPHLMGPVAAKDALDGASAPDPDGWVTVRLPVETLDVAAQQLLGFGPDAEVLAPDSLRVRMADAARRMAARYQQDPHPTENRDPTLEVQPRTPGQAAFGDADVSDAVADGEGAATR